MLYPADGNFVHQLQYKPFLRHFKKVASAILPNSNLRIGLHCFRKTTYLLGIWGGGEWGELKWSARHASDRRSIAV